MQVPSLLSEKSDKAAESYIHAHCWQKMCAAVLLCFNSNFLVSDDKRQDKYSA